MHPPDSAHKTGELLCYALLHCEVQMLLPLAVTQGPRCWPLFCAVLSEDACLEAQILCWGSGRGRLSSYWLASFRTSSSVLGDCAAHRGVVFWPFQRLQSHNKASSPCLSCVRNMLLMLRFRPPASIQRQQEKAQANTRFSMYSVFPWAGRWKF